MLFQMYPELVKRLGKISTCKRHRSDGLQRRAQTQGSRAARQVANMTAALSHPARRIHHNGIGAQKEAHRRRGPAKRLGERKRRWRRSTVGTPRTISTTDCTKLLQNKRPRYLLLDHPTPLLCRRVANSKATKGAAFMKVC